MDKSRYVLERMSFDPTDSYLSSLDKEPNQFRRVLLRARASNFPQGDVVEEALEVLAERAINEGCEYVANIQSHGYSTYRGAGFFTPGTHESITLTGTGLIPKEK